MVVRAATVAMLDGTVCGLRVCKMNGDMHEWGMQSERHDDYC